MSKTFKFIHPEFKRGTNEEEATTDRVREILQKMGQGKGLDTSAKIAVPLGDGMVDVVDNYRWTKTDKKSPHRQDTPKITLKELQVVNPSFFNNFSLLLDQLATNNTNSGLFSILKDSLDANRTERADELNRQLGVEPETEESTWDWLKRNIQKGLENAEAGVQTLQNDWQGLKSKLNPYTKFSMPKYLKYYEDIYGVNPTGFVYRLPYLEDTFKQITNSWGGEDEASGFIGSNISRITKLTSAAAPSVGVDYAKSFQYPSDGPSHNVTFYLDNTLQGGTAATYNSIAENINFVYLLLYQNLPSRINRTSIIPPVIYQASLPGVFSYRWSFLSNITINFVGNRRRYRVRIGGKMTEAVIPEGYEIQMTINSLTPETKNLMFDSIDDTVTSSEVINPNNFEAPPLIRKPSEFRTPDIGPSQPQP